MVVALALAEGGLRWLDLADPPTFRRDPEYGYLMSPQQSVSTRGHRFSINQAGLRGREIDSPKRSEALRIAFVGDSITYGGGSIRQEDLFVERAARLVGSSTEGEMETINVSAPGWGIQNMAAYIGREGVHGADIVLWVISAVDFRRPKMSMEENGFVSQKPLLRVFYLLEVVRFHFMRGEGPSSQDGGDALNDNLRTFRETLSRIRGSGPAAGVVFVPTDKGYPVRRDLTLYRRVAESLGIPTLDLEPALRGGPPRSLFRDGVHLGPEGHRVAAENMAPFIQALWSPNHATARVRHGSSR